MKAKKSKNLDVAYVHLRKGRVAKTVEIRPGLLLDLDKTGEVLGIEVMSLEKLAPVSEGHHHGHRARKSLSRKVA